MEKCRVTALIYSSKENTTCFNPLIIVNATDPVEVVKQKALALYFKRVGEWLNVVSMHTYNAGALATIADEADAVVDVLGYEAQLMIIVNEAVDLISASSSALGSTALQLATPLSSASPSLDLDTIRMIPGSTTLTDAKHSRKQKKREQKRQKRQLMQKGHAESPQQQNHVNDEPGKNRLRRQTMPQRQPYSSNNPTPRNFGTAGPENNVTSDSPGGLVAGLTSDLFATNEASEDYSQDGFHFVTKKRKLMVNLEEDKPKKQKVTTDASEIAINHDVKEEYTHASSHSGGSPESPNMSTFRNPGTVSRSAGVHTSTDEEQTRHQTECEQEGTTDLIQSPRPELINPVSCPQPHDMTIANPDIRTGSIINPTLESHDSTRSLSSQNGVAIEQKAPLQPLVGPVSTDRTTSTVDDAISVASSSIHESDLSLSERDGIRTFCPVDAGPDVDAQFAQQSLTIRELAKDRGSQEVEDKPIEPQGELASPLSQMDNLDDTTDSEHSPESDLADYLSSEESDASRSSTNRLTPTPMTRTEKPSRASGFESDNDSDTSSMRSGHSAAPIRANSSDSSDVEDDTDREEPEASAMNPSLHSDPGANLESDQIRNIQGVTESDVAGSRSPEVPVSSTEVLMSRPGLRSTYRPLSYLHEQSLRETDDPSKKNVPSAVPESVPATLSDADDSSSDSSSNSSNESDSDTNLPANKRAKTVKSSRRNRQSEGARALLSLT